MMDCKINLSKAEPSIFPLVNLIFLKETLHDQIQILNKSEFGPNQHWKAANTKNYDTATTP